MQKHQYKIFFILQTFIYKRSLLAALYERTNAHFYVTIKLAKRSSSASQSDKTSVSPFRAEEGTQQTSWGGFVMARSRIVETSFLSRSDNIIIISRWQGSLKGALCKLFRRCRWQSFHLLEKKHTEKLPTESSWGLDPHSTFHGALGKPQTSLASLPYPGGHTSAPENRAVARCPHVLTTKWGNSLITIENVEFALSQTVSF